MGLGILIESYLRFQICFRCCLVDSKCQSIKYRQKGFGSSSKNTQISVSQAYHGYFLLCGLETAFLCYHPDDFFFFPFLAQKSPVLWKPFSYKHSVQCNANAEGSDRRILMQCLRLRYRRGCLFFSPLLLPPRSHTYFVY